MTKFQKPFAARSSSNWAFFDAFIGINMLICLLFGLISCGNERKTPASTSEVSTEKTAPVQSTPTVNEGNKPEELKAAQVAQSPLHKFIDSLNTAKQPQWKLSYLDSIARTNKNITIPQLKHILDSLNKVKKGFIKR